MIYEKRDNGESALVLSEAEHDRLKAGQTIKHQVGSMYGDFEIRVQMVMIREPEERVGETMLAARIGRDSETVATDPILRNRHVGDHK